MLLAVPATAQETPQISPTAEAPPSVTEEAPAATEAVPAPEPAAAPARPAPVGIDPDLVPHDLSPWGMFMSADLVVKAVMIGLAFASLVTWTIWASKALELAGARWRLRRAVARLRRCRTMAEASKAIGRNSPASVLLHAAEEELRLSEGAADKEGVKERVSLTLSRLEAAAGRAVTRGTGVLATIGSTAPFVGLFGTVWGIMNSFVGISKAQTTNLAVVAPGIAEALLATATGLVAAIPAVVIYNVFARSIGGYRALVGDAAAEVLRLLSRDLDRRLAADRTVLLPPRAAE